MSDDILVKVKALLPTPSGVGVFLSDGQKTIAIFVDHSVAAAITMFLHGIHRPRPLTHDLISHIFAGLGVKVQRVLVNDLKDETFFARLYLCQENELGKSFIEIDARPSDSIAIALQQKCPIYVSLAVMEKADDMSWALKQAETQKGSFGAYDLPEEEGEKRPDEPPEDA